MSRNESEYYYYSDNKVREVQRKLNYMRADAPPKGSLTIRKKDDHSHPSTSPSSSIHELLLNDEKYNYLKASFKQQLSPSPSTTKHFDFTGKPNHNHSPARNDFNHNRHAPGHYGSVPLNQPHDQDDARSSNVSSTMQTQLVQNILSTSPTHRPQHDVSDHPLVHELSRRGLTSSCKKRKTQTEVRREVETKLLFS